MALIATISGVIAALVRAHGFPAPVVVVKGARGWLATDMKAYAQGKPYPKREPDELRSRYLTRADIAKRLGKSEGAVKGGDLREALEGGSASAWLPRQVPLLAQERLRPLAQERAQASATPWRLTGRRLTYAKRRLRDQSKRKIGLIGERCAI